MPKCTSVKKAFHHYTPYIYTEDEILTIWDAFDHLKPRGGFPVRQYVVPAMVKLKRVANEGAIPENSTLKNYLNAERYTEKDDDLIKRLYGLK